MEKSYGIEAARAKLGEIADHARSTGQTIALTRHGRTVAVVGPAEAIRPAQGVKVDLNFLHVDRTAQLPALPRTGEIFYWDDPDYGEGRWEVTEIVHFASAVDASIHITLDPADEDARRQIAKKRGERP